MALTAKQEAFCRNITAGMTGKDAYLKAYDSKAGANTAYVEATRLLDKEHIQKRLEDLRKPLAIKAQAEAMTHREEVQQMLLGFMRDETLTPETRMKASDQLNKMNLEYIQIQHNIEDRQTQIINLDTDTLKRLSNDL